LPLQWQADCEAPVGGFRLSVDVSLSNRYFAVLDCFVTPGAGYVFPPCRGFCILYREFVMRASDIRRGQAVIVDGKLFVVTNADHNTPGNLRAKVQFKLRDVSKGTIQDKRVGATDDIETATLDRRQVEYLYSDNDGHVLMDLETFDQTTIPKEVFGSDILYLKPNTPMTAMFHEGRVVSYELPKTVDLKVTETPPGIKGATATNQQKDAELETGLKTRVPPFIEIGEVVRISTETGAYLSRA
jgi:elongation factor P